MADLPTLRLPIPDPVLDRLDAIEALLHGLMAEVQAQRATVGPGGRHNAASQVPTPITDGEWSAKVGGGPRDGWCVFVSYRGDAYGWPFDRAKRQVVYMQTQPTVADLLRAIADTQALLDDAKTEPAGLVDPVRPVER